MENKIVEEVEEQAAPHRVYEYDDLKVKLELTKLMVRYAEIFPGDTEGMLEAVEAWNKQLIEEHTYRRPRTYDRWRSS